MNNNSLLMSLYFMFLISSAVASESIAQSTITDKDETEDGFFALDWLDRTQVYASNSADSIANQVDRFFGVAGSDLDAAYSSLRLTGIHSWDRIDGPEMDVRIRGKVHLPRLDERISLIFSEDERESLTDSSQNNVVSGDEEKTKVDLGYTVHEDIRQRLNFRVGLSSSLKARVSLRYRYEFPIADAFLNRLSQIIFFKDGDGLGTISQYQLDMRVSERSLLRWTSDVRFDEGVAGFEWNTALSFLHKQTDKLGMTYYYRARGQTNPDFTSVSEIGVRVRRNVLRPWLFVELEPGYTWQKTEITQKREHSPFVFFRVEMAIGHTPQ